MSRTRMTTLAFLLLELCPLLLFEFDIMSALQHEYPSGYFDDTWLKCRTGRDDKMHTRMKTLAFLLMELYPLLVFNFDFVSAL